MKTGGNNLLFDIPAAAYVRAVLPDGHRLPAGLRDRPLAHLSAAEREQVVAAGRNAGLRLHRFKRTMGLARVARVLGILRALRPTGLLDIGSGRGTFLWPLLDAFPQLPVMAIDRDERRVADLLAVRRGGIGTLDGRIMDATRLEFADGAFDVVTCLETLEHVQDAGRALAEIVRVAGRFAVVSVPSHPDDNPEHIHLFGREELIRRLEAAGAVHVNTGAVLNHWIAVARVY